jgi:hypothetical protein
MRRMTPDGRWLAAVWPFVRGQLPPAPASVLEIGRRRGLPALPRTGFAVGILLAGLVADLVGLVAAVWVIAALTAASGLVVAVRTYETQGR